MRECRERRRHRRAARDSAAERGTVADNNPAAGARCDVDTVSAPISVSGCFGSGHGIADCFGFCRSVAGRFGIGHSVASRGRVTKRGHVTKRNRAINAGAESERHPVAASAAVAIDLTAAVAEAAARRRRHQRDHAADRAATADTDADDSRCALVRARRDVDDPDRHP